MIRISDLIEPGRALDPGEVTRLHHCFAPPEMALLTEERSTNKRDSWKNRTLFLNIFLNSPAVFDRYEILHHASNSQREMLYNSVLK